MITMKLNSEGDMAEFRLTGFVGDKFKVYRSICRDCGAVTRKDDDGKWFNLIDVQCVARLVDRLSLEGLKVRVSQSLEERLGNMDQEAADFERMDRRRLMWFDMALERLAEKYGHKRGKERKP